jgi:3-hydroxyacyl-CoA dehydrogenase
MALDSIKTVAVLGAGTMGNGITHVFARAGYNVILRDVDHSFLERALDTIGKNLDREIKKGKLPESEKPAVLSRIKTVIDVTAISGADFALEAVPEKFEIKRAVLTDADKILRPEVVLASNTSSISMTTLAALTSRPDRFARYKPPTPHSISPWNSLKNSAKLRSPSTTPRALSPTASSCRLSTKPPTVSWKASPLPRP